MARMFVLRAGLVLELIGAILLSLDVLKVDPRKKIEGVIRSGIHFSIKMIKKLPGFDHSIYVYIVIITIWIVISLAVERIFISIFALDFAYTSVYVQEYFTSFTLTRFWFKKVYSLTFVDVVWAVTIFIFGPLSLYQLLYIKWVRDSDKPLTPKKERYLNFANNLTELGRLMLLFSASPFILPGILPAAILASFFVVPWGVIFGPLLIGNLFANHVKSVPRFTGLLLLVIGFFIQLTSTFMTS